MAAVLEHAPVVPALPDLGRWVKPVIFAVLGLGLAGGVVLNVTADTTTRPTVAAAVQTHRDAISADTGNIGAPYQPTVVDNTFSTCFISGLVVLPAQSCPLLD